MSEQLRAVMCEPKYHRAGVVLGLVPNPSEVQRIVSDCKFGAKIKRNREENRGPVIERLITTHFCFECDYTAPTSARMLFHRAKKTRIYEPAKSKHSRGSMPSVTQSHTILRLFWAPKTRVKLVKVITWKLLTL